MTTNVAVLLLATACSGAQTKEAPPPPELLQNMDFFMKYGLVENLDTLESSPDLQPHVGVSTGTAKSADIDRSKRPDVPARAPSAGGKR